MINLKLNKHNVQATPIFHYLAFIIKDSAQVGSVKN